MTDYTADNFGTRGSPSKKVQERKLEITSEWGDLVRNQQALAERMIQQEKDVKRLQRDELKNTLQYQMQEKQNARRSEDTNARQLDYNVSIARKADYDNYQSRVKQDNVQLQRNLAVDYSRQQQEREEERRRKIEQEKMVDQRTVTDALDSLQREKMIKDRQREDFKQAVAQQLREKEEMKRMEQERIAREREDQKRLMEENAYKIQAKDSNYRDYYKRVDYQQRNMQQAHDQIVGDKLRAKDRQIDDFINKGVEEARLRAEREEYERQARKQEQLRSMKESVQTKIQEHEDQKRIEKMSYQNKVEDLMRQNVAMQAHQDQMRQYRNNQINDYKATLEYQMKEAEEQKRRQQANMLEHEKKILMNPNDLGLIPGLRSTKADTITSPTFKSSNLINNKPGYPGASNVFVPQQPSAALNTSGSSYGSNYGGQFDSVKSPKLNTSVGNIDYQRHDNHNPITNPMNTNQNPYIRGVDNRAAGFSQRNTFSNAATNNLYGTQ